MDVMSARRDRRITRTTMRWATVVLLAPMFVLTACGSSDSSTPTDVATVTPATPSSAPAGAAVNPAGRVIAATGDGGGTQIALSGDWIGVLSRVEAKSVRLINRADPSAEQKIVALPSGFTRMVSVGDGKFLGVGPGLIGEVSTAGVGATAKLGTNDPTAVARTADGQIVVGTGNGHVLVLDSAFTQKHDYASFVRVDNITVSPAGADLSSEQVVVLDRAQSSVTPITLSDGNLGPALRAGNGATNSVVDRFGRVLVANTRDNEMIGFFGSPLVMRFRYPLAAGPYALDYDDKADLLWVTSTGDNQVTGFDLGSGEPQQKYRFAAVAQPDSMTVDDSTGTVYVLSTRDGSVQVVAPADRGAAASSAPSASPAATSAAPTSTAPTSGTP